MRDSSNSEGTVPCTTASPNLLGLILDSPQHTTLSVAGQHATRKRCYLYFQCNHFIDCINDPVPEGAVIYADALFWYDEQKGTYTEFFGYPTGYIFLAANRNHEYLLSHRGTTLHLSHAPIKSRKS